MIFLIALFGIGLSGQFHYVQGAVVYPKPIEAEPCDHPIDLIVILDSSGSVMPTWNNTIDFTEMLLSNFNISNTEVRVGLIEFSMVANALIPLDSGNTLGRLYQALEEVRVSPQNGETHTDKALYLASRIFRASQRAYNVPKILVIFTDGELTSGNFSELEPHISDLSAQKVEIFSVAQGDDQVDEGLQRISKSKDYDHTFSLTPNAVNVPHVTKSLARAICNVKINDGQKDAANDAIKVQESTTTVENSGKQEYFEAKNWAQEKPLPEATGIQPVHAYEDVKASVQSANLETAMYNNLQQPVGRPKEVYPENAISQPHPSMPLTKLPDTVPHCNINVTKIGCYNDSGVPPQPLPILIMKGRHKDFHIGSNKEGFDKMAWKEFLPEFICECANKIRERKFWTFGIQNFDECYSGPDEGRYDEDGLAKLDDCIDDEYHTCAESSEYCSGLFHKNYIYTILSDLHKDIVRIEYD